MNQGQLNELLNALLEQTRQLDEIRRTLNRIDGRLKEQAGEPVKEKGKKK